MAEPPAAAPAGVTASEQDPLLATKLHVPRPQPGFVPAPAWWRHSMKGGRWGSSWCAPRPDSVRRSS